MQHLPASFFAENQKGFSRLLPYILLVMRRERLYIVVLC